MPPAADAHRLAAGVAEEQASAISRQQLLDTGLTDRQLQAAVRSGRWQRPLPGVYITFTGPPPPLTRLWCYLLYCGDGAAASHSSAMWLHDGRDNLPQPVEISVPHERRVRRVPGLVIRRRRDLDDVRQAAGQPPRTRIAVTVLDLAQEAAREEQALDPVLRAIQRRLTTPDRLRAELARRPRHRWRTLLVDVLAEAEDGVTTPLELRYARDVETAHGLPKAERNLPKGAPGQRRYYDNRYEEWALLVELDGQEAHPPENRYLDRRRDNASTLDRRDTLRYGWRDVVEGARCTTAAEVAQALTDRGWAGHPGPCAPTCEVST